MFALHGKFIGGWRFLVLLGTVLMSGMLHAAEPAEQIAGSLKFVPATASAYSSMLRVRETIDAVANSKAWKKLRELPILQKAWDALQTEPQFTEAVDEIKEFFADEQNKELLALLSEMIGDEVFVYTDDQW